jgi:hypothetical protein
MIDQRDRADIAEPPDANEPIDSHDANEPTDPMLRNEPIDPIERTDPFDPMQSNESSDHRDHRDVAARPSCSTQPFWPRGEEAGTPPDGRCLIGACPRRHSVLMIRCGPER